MVSVGIVHFRTLLGDFSKYVLWSSHSAMTVHAPAHIHGRELIDLVHLANVTMASLAGHALGNVTLVREVDEVRQFVNTNPLNRRPFAVMLLNLLNMGAVRFNDRVTVHAHIDGRHRSMTRLFDPHMAIGTGHLVIAGMQLMTEWNGLFRNITLIGSSRIEELRSPSADCHDKNSQNQNDLFLTTRDATHEAPPVKTRSVRVRSFFTALKRLKMS